MSAARELFDAGPPPENGRGRALGTAAPSVSTNDHDTQKIGPQTPPRQALLATKPDPDGDFDWATDSSVIISEQPETALYWNDRHQLVIRQRRWPDEDSFVFFNSPHLKHLICMLQAEAESLE
jgi:hypothetical protein